jgi:thioredoxin reductase (NADPH)
MSLRARHVLLATGAEDVEPELPDLPNAVRQGLVRYCPICDGFEARGQRIAVIGHGARGLGEAEFIASTYSSAVTLLTLGREDEEAGVPAPLALEPEERHRARSHGIAIIRQPVVRLATKAGRLASVTTADGAEHAFDSIYSALGLRPRAGLAAALGASCDGGGALVIDDRCQTSVPGLYAAGGVAHGLDQVVIAMAHAAAATTAIHNALRRGGAFGRFGLHRQGEEPRRAG